MRATWYEKIGAARDVLQVGTMPDPQPQAGEVLVRLATSGVNPSDWKARSGFRPMGFDRIIPHSDGAGIIERVGDGVSKSRIGERVWMWNGQWKRAFGTAAEFMAVPEQQAVALPSHVSFAAGACLGIPALTAYRALTVDGSAQGQAILVTGGAGAVGHYAIQMAKLLGAGKILTTVSSEEKAEHARKAGADVVINYRTEDLVDRTLSETGGLGVDRIVDVDIAGHAKLLPRLLARDGLAVAYGSNEASASFDFIPMITSGAAVRFFIVYALSKHAREQGLAALTRWLERDDLQHAIAAEYGLDQVIDAHEAVERRELIGNVILTM
jgi:NADPH2:quinone reductase